MALRRDLILTVSMYKATEKARLLAKAKAKSPGPKAVAKSEVVAGAKAGASKGSGSSLVVLPPDTSDSKWGEEKTVGHRLQPKPNLPHLLLHLLYLLPPTWPTSYLPPPTSYLLYLLPPTSYLLPPTSLPPTSYFLPPTSYLLPYLCAHRRGRASAAA